MHVSDPKYVTTYSGLPCFFCQGFEIWHGYEMLWECSFPYWMAGCEDASEAQSMLVQARFLVGCLVWCYPFHQRNWRLAGMPLVSFSSTWLSGRGRGSSKPCTQSLPPHNFYLAICCSKQSLSIRLWRKQILTPICLELPVDPNNDFLKKLLDILDWRILRFN